MSTDSSRIPRSPGTAPTGTAGLRVDARHNRDRIVEAAREAFSELGIDVPMAAIARRARVGVATLYRRFPTRESLVTEVFAEQLTECASVVDDALAEPDAWHGFRTLIEKVCAMQALDRGFTEAFLSAFPDALDYERTRVRAEQGLAELVRRAQASGRLRADFAPEDVVLVLMANSGLVAGSARSAPAASRRLVAYLIESFRADRAAPDEPLPPTAPLSLGHLGLPGSGTGRSG
ncbi:TetR/AcrR family transcriptional regulator [Actinorugispora endophytica]|uniref:TetR family transcriptional regulator n=1 Tax=Actinorugispora endophytica TaxID=1605990 RepID=A0A4R6V8Q9_9ACTN|nr:TetR/AcrR family transcriptional regulator [Actinorugispora endophytica]TDQ55556.1 TetR family transcriptional regulator [Actinorugispora endophytica]